MCSEGYLLLMFEVFMEIDYVNRFYNGKKSLIYWIVGFNVILVVYGKMCWLFCKVLKLKVKYKFNI